MLTLFRSLSSLYAHACPTKFYLEQGHVLCETNARDKWRVREKENKRTRKQQQTSDEEEDKKEKVHGPLILNSKTKKNVIKIVYQQK